MSRSALGGLEPIHPRERRRQRRAALQALVDQYRARIRAQRRELPPWPATAGMPGRQNA